MNNFLYLLAFVLVVMWMIGFFAYSAGRNKSHPVEN